MLAVLASGQWHPGGLRQIAEWSCSSDLLFLVFFFRNVSFDDVLSLMLNFLQLLPLPDVCCNNLLSVLTYLSLLIS